VVMGAGKEGKDRGRARKMKERKKQLRRV